MSFPQNLPKPPPKSLPPKGLPPGARPPAAPVAAAVGGGLFRPAASPAPIAALPSANRPSLAPINAAKPAAKPTPLIDTRGLPANLAPMVEAITLYDELLVEENALLKAGDAKGVAELLDRKMAATRLYQERLRTVLGDPQCTRSLTPDQRTNVVSLVKCLEERAEENAVLLKANMSAIEQLFEVINLAARKMRKQEVAYSKAGMICDNYSRYGSSLAYNRTI